MGGEIRSIIDALANSLIPKVVGVLFGFFLVFTLAVGVFQNLYSWTDANPPAIIGSIDTWKLGMVVGTTGTATAVMVTLYVADRNYRRSREHVPNLSMELQVQRVPASQLYDAVVVTLDAKNTGTGLCEIEEVQWSVRVMSPYDDDVVLDMQKEFDDKPYDDRVYEFPWHEVKRDSTKCVAGIEPNETEQITYDFTIPAEPTALVVSAWVPNASEPKIAEGWYRRTIHSIQDI
ncbi:MAG: hypothetical protein OXH22_08510 [Chloroflexi bacterium]|nr:hypothetical protein [Chloroflexota bacterium]